MPSRKPALQINRFQIGTQYDRVVYPHHIDAKLDPDFHFDTDPDQNLTMADLDPAFFRRIWILIKVMRICNTVLL
jgi:hypothetical protein